MISSRIRTKQLLIPQISVTYREDVLQKQELWVILHPGFLRTEILWHERHYPYD